MTIANQFSFIFFFSISGTALLFLMLRSRGASWRVTLSALSAAAALAVIAFFILRPGLSDVSSAQAARAIVRSGKPTLIEFYSNYCIGCMVVRPAVDALAADIQASFPDAFNILRIDIHTDFGRELRDIYGFSYTPEFILFNAQGQETWRSHAPPSLNDIRRLIPTDSLTGRP
jgi:thiol-disulfide isomerase/thioredoxin